MDIYSGLEMEDFLLAVLAGGLLAVFYDALRIFRILLGVSRGVTVVLDLLFMGTASVLTFLVCLAANFGYLRLVILLGEAMGFSLYFLTLGFFTLWLVRKFLQVIHFLEKKILFPVMRWIWKTVSRPPVILYKKIRDNWERRRTNRTAGKKERKKGKVFGKPLEKT